MCMSPHQANKMREAELKNAERRVAEIKKVLEK